MSIELVGISKRHGAIVALDTINLTVATGEFLALLGPSGSGKTTLLRVIAGLERGYGGIVRIGGADMSNVSARARGIGFVFQSYALFRHMTVAENVAFGLRVRPRGRRPSEAEMMSRVAGLLALVQLGDLGARYPDQLSGGQRQRVALARALAIEPNVLLLDEPFGALDPPIRIELRAILRGLHERLGLTTVLVTHDREEAFGLADRIALLRRGSVEQFGTAEALETEPASPFVFEFLGEGASLPGTVRDGQFVFDGPLAPIATRLRPGPAVALVRPDEASIRSGNGPARIVAMQRRVRFSQYVVDLGGFRLQVDMPGPPSASLAVGHSCEVELSFARLLPVAASPQRTETGAIEGGLVLT